MPKYVSLAGLRLRHGSEYLIGSVVGDAPGEGTDVDVESVDWAIRDAEALVDTYLDRRQLLPLPGVEDVVSPEANPYVPDVLRMVAADIAFYRLASEHDRMTDEKKARYEQAIKLLDGFDKTGRGLGVTGVEAPTKSVSITSGLRAFTRDDTGGLL